MSPRRAIGFGAASAARLDDLLALIRSIPGALGATCLATIERRAELAAEAAAALELDLRLFSAEQLAAIDGTVTRSSRSAETVGSPSVAEAAALAALGPRARLAVPRRTGILCTCALAELP